MKFFISAEKKSGETELTEKNKVKKSNSAVSSLKWVLFVSRRFSKVDRKGKTKITSFLASLGICFGVMTLICVLSVMNGFQMSFIDAIMEVNSCHLRVKNFNHQNESNFAAFCGGNPDVRAFFPFYEAQSLLVGRNGNQNAALIRAVPDDIFETDEGFRKETVMRSGSFDLHEEDSIVLGTELARKLGLNVGGKVSLFALSGGNDVSLLSSDRIFTVKGTFRTGYADINSTFAFISLSDGKKYFGADAELLYGIKLFNTEKDAKFAAEIKQNFPELDCQSWKEYNRSFFGTLKIEKNMLILLVFIIFVVVAVNIFNGMRRIVFERREEISLLTALGAKNTTVQFIFILQGFLTGVKGAVPGLILGLLLTSNMAGIFMCLSKISYFFQLMFVSIFSPENARFVFENPMYLVYANIPPRIFPGEILFITVFGIFSSLFASWIASRGILKLTVAEVMRDE